MHDSRENSLSPIRRVREVHTPGTFVASFVFDSRIGRIYMFFSFDANNRAN